LERAQGVVWRRLQSYCGTYEWSVRANSGRSITAHYANDIGRKSVLFVSG